MEELTLSVKNVCSPEVMRDLTFIAEFQETKIGPVIEMKIVCVLLEFTEPKFQFLQQEILNRHLGCWYLQGRTDLWIKWIPVSVTMFPAVICWEHKQTRKRKRVPTMMNGASGDGLAFLTLLQVPVKWKRILLFSRKIQCVVRRLFTYERTWKIIPRNPNYQGWSLSEIF